MPVTITSNGNAPVAKVAKKKPSKAQKAAADVRTAARAKEKALKDKAKAAADKELRAALKAAELSKPKASALIKSAGEIPAASLLNKLNTVRLASEKGDIRVQSAEVDVICHFVSRHGTEVLVPKSPEYKAAYKVIKADYQHRIAVEPCPIRKASLSNQFGTLYGRLLKHAAKMVRAAGLPCSKAASAMLVKLMDKGGNKGRKANKLKEAVSFKAYSAVIINMVAERFTAFADKEMGFTPKTELDNVIKLYRSIGLGCGVDFDAAVAAAQLKNDK